jgi:hypothetical protein
MIEHIVADSIKSLIKGLTPKALLKNVCPGTFEDVCKTNHWKFKMDDYGYNGWEVDWWGDIITDSGTVHIYGCMYYGTAILTLKENG